MLPTSRRIEGQIEPAIRSHDPAHMRETLLDDLDRRMGEHAVGMHDVEPLIGEPAKPQVVHEPKSRFARLQLVTLHRLIGGKEHIGRDVEALVATRLEVARQAPTGSQVPAADVEQIMVGLQPVPYQVVELEFSQREPPVTTRAPNGPVWIGGHVVTHDRSIEGDVIPGSAQPEPQIAPGATQMGPDAFWVSHGISEAIGDPITLVRDGLTFLTRSRGSHGEGLGNQATNRLEAR